MKKYLFFGLIICIGLLFTIRLFQIQILDTSFQKRSESNAVKKIIDYPQRGYIFDRNRELLVSNQPAYDVMVIPREIAQLDTLALTTLLNISKETLDKKLSRAKQYSYRLPSVILPQLTKKEYALLAEKIYKFKGFYIQKRSLREYQVNHSANVLGYIAEVNNRIIKEDAYYQLGDLIGTQAVEKAYEHVLRGKKGVKYIQKDIHNQDIGPYKNGLFDTLPERGKDIVLTIDAKLQAYGEALMKNKRGGIVAIEPNTGEILALVAAPNYNPSLLVGRERSKNYTKLYYDSISKPLFDRVLQGEYPPGSPFKTLIALIAQQEQVLNPTETVTCYGKYHYGGKKPMGCHSHTPRVDMIKGIAYSCNSYFATAYRRTIEKYDTPQLGMDAWHTHLSSFGLGNYLGYDLPIGKKGLIPNADFYNKYYQYPTYNWYATATISNAIGQGEVLLTPIQMAHFTAVIANKGWYYTPHIIKEIVGTDSIPSKFKEKQYTTIDPTFFDPVIEGMHQVYEKGTAKYIRIPGIEICGKTGTAENFTKINGEVLQLTDHSIFTAFAPKDNPKIAIAVFVENGYWGFRWAGKIAGLMIEKYLKGTISRTDLERYILNGSLEEEYAKPLSGKPFEINQ